MKRLVLLVALVSTVVDADDRAHPYADRPLNFSLTLSTRSYDLDYGGSTIDTSVDRVTASWRERYGERLQLGFFGGPAYLTQTNNTATSGHELNGYHAGLSLDIDLWRARSMDAFFSAVWLYQKVDHDASGQRVTIATSEPGVRLGTGVSVVPNLRFHGGFRYGGIRGEQRLSGTMNETRTVRESRQGGGFAGIELTLDRDGYVGLDAHSGTDRGVGISFGRYF